MFDFGDDLVIDSYRIPWLIWIQIFVMCLLTLTILVSYFGFSALDNGDVSTNGGSLSLTSSSTPRFQPSSTCLQRTQVAANLDVREEVSTTRAESNSERDGSSVKDLSPSRTSELVFHPCRYLEAFLKCFGLGSAFKKSPSCDKKHKD